MPTGTAHHRGARRVAFQALSLACYLGAIAPLGAEPVPGRPIFLTEQASTGVRDAMVPTEAEAGQQDSLCPCTLAAYGQTRNTQPAGCLECPHAYCTPFVSYDSFQGIPDAGWSNYGVVVGANASSRLGWLSD